MQRRNFLKLSSFTLATPLMAEYWNVDWSVHHPNDFSIELAIAEITNGQKLQHSNKIKLTVPEIAENGAVVPVKVTIDSPMNKDDYIKNIYILTDNGNSRAIYVTLTPKNGKAHFATRVKLKSSGRCKVLAIVKHSDGDFFIEEGMVKVTIGGGCC
jgi:sulfur-oxidizing protein SoxY